MLQSAVLVVGVIFIVATLIADILYVPAQSAHPLRGRRGMTATTPQAAAPGSAPPVDTSELRLARRETLRALLRSKTFLIGFGIVGFWVVCAIFGSQIAPQNRSSRTPRHPQGAVRRDTGSVPTTSAETSSRA